MFRTAVTHPYVLTADIVLFNLILEPLEVRTYDILTQLAPHMYSSKTSRVPSKAQGAYDQWLTKCLDPISG